MIPRRDLTLPDGRRLRYKGLKHTPTTTGHAHEYKHPEGLTVWAEAAEYGLHVSISHKTREPTTEEVDALQSLFFEPGADINRHCPQRDRPEDLRAASVAAGIPIHSFPVWHLVETTHSKMN